MDSHWLIDLQYSICLYSKYFIGVPFLLAILSSPLLFIKKEWKFKIIPVVLLILAYFIFLLSWSCGRCIDFF